ncbi:MAG: ribosomal protein S18-alanine N-acetyltransferase [Bryobacteraceae bacterium]
MTVRAATETDLEAIARIETACFAASAWNVRDYLSYQCMLAEWEGAVAGFIVIRKLPGEDNEILSLAVAPEFRRRGVASALCRHAMEHNPGRFFLEVRESNSGARKLYGKLGFTELGRRPEYYHNPRESAIVLTIRSC